MSDMQMGGRPPMAGSPPMPGKQPDNQAMQALKGNASMFNPVDIAGMRSPGHPMHIDPQKTTIREYLTQQGVDVDGPVIQLVKFAQDQAGKANPINKMQNMAQQGGGGMPVPPGGQMKPPQGPPGGSPVGGSSGGGLESLMREMGG